MLEKLLRALQAGKPTRPDELARELQTTPQLVVAMLEQLARLGYLAPLEGGCGHGCAGCPTVRACASEPAAQAWVLTEKGAARRA